MACFSVYVLLGSTIRSKDKYNILDNKEALVEGMTILPCINLDTMEIQLECKEALLQLQEIQREHTNRNEECHGSQWIISH